MESDSRIYISNKMSCLILMAHLLKKQNAIKYKILKVNDFQGFNSGPDWTNI